MAAEITVLDTQYGGAYTRGVWIAVVDHITPAPGYQKILLPYDLFVPSEPPPGGPRLDYVRCQIPNPKNGEELLGPQVDLRAGQILTLAEGREWEVEPGALPGTWNIVLYVWLAAMDETHICFVEYGIVHSVPK